MVLLDESGHHPEICRTKRFCYATACCCWHTNHTPCQLIAVAAIHIESLNYLRNEQEHARQSMTKSASDFWMLLILKHTSAIEIQTKKSMQNAAAITANLAATAHKEREKERKEAKLKQQGTHTGGSSSTQHNAVTTAQATTCELY